MIDTLLAFVPTYGLWLIFVCVALSCLAVPIPSSMLVMAAGGFSAAGDFAYWNLVLFSFSGFLLGDQLAYLLARRAGAPLITRFQAKPRFGKVIDKAQRLLEQYGAFAVILTRTIFGPIGPYVAYVSGALKTPWMRFAPASAIGAFLWCVGYSALGYVFTGQIEELAQLISSSVGIVVAGTSTLMLAGWLIGNYLRALRAQQRGEHGRTGQCVSRETHP